MDLGSRALPTPDDCTEIRWKQSLESTFEAATVTNAHITRHFAYATLLCPKRLPQAVFRLEARLDSCNDFLQLGVGVNVSCSTERVYSQRE